LGTSDSWLRKVRPKSQYYETCRSLSITNRTGNTISDRKIKIIGMYKSSYRILSIFLLYFMEENTSIQETYCCPKFNPALWDDKEITWNNKLFIKDRVRSFLHIPLNFGAVAKRCAKKIDAAQAEDSPPVWLSDENSLWGSNLYIAVTKDISGATMTTLSGTYLTKVFEGPYKNAHKWAKEMETYVLEKGKDLKKIYFFYTTCPKCAKAYGKNYVVLVAQI